MKPAPSTVTVVPLKFPFGAREPYAPREFQLQTDAQVLIVPADIVGDYDVEVAEVVATRGLRFFRRLRPKYNVAYYASGSRFYLNKVTTILRPVRLGEMPQGTKFLALVPNYYHRGAETPDEPVLLWQVCTVKGEPS